MRKQITRDAAEFRGDALRLARQFQGLSLAELGEHVGTTRQFIHQLETNAKVPASTMAEALAQTLDVQPKFFHTAVSNEIREEHCHFRRRRKAPKAIISQLLAHGTLLGRLIATIDQQLSLPSMMVPHVDVVGESDIEKAARKCRMMWGLSADQPIKSMTRAVENAGVIVVHVPGVSDRLDALSIDHARPVIVRSMVKASATRFRFDIAHELGHLVMHSGVETGDDITEKQADQFAASFLLPQESFCEEFPARGRRIDWMSLFAMKARWGVSLQALLYRAHELRLIDTGTYSIAMRTISKRGWRSFEPKEPEIETPELLQIALTTLWQHFRLGRRGLADMLRVQPAFLTRLLGPDIEAAIPIEHEKISSLMISRLR